MTANKHKPAKVSDAYREAVEQAQRETEAALANDPSRNSADPTLPIFQFAAREELEKERARFDAGDKNALLGAMRVCANHDLVMPDWLARAFIAAYDKVLNVRVGSWDDAFGRPFPKGKHLSAMRKKRKLAPAVWLEVQRLHREQRRPIDDQLFDEVGTNLGLGKTLAGEYYYSFAARVKDLYE